MAVTLTAAEILAAIEGDADQADNTHKLAEVTRLRAVFVEVLAKRAPHAPAPIADEAALRWIGWMRGQPEVDRSRAGARYAAAWVNAGCASLVKPWVRRRGVVGRDDD